MAQKKNQEPRKKAIYSRKSKWTGKGESVENQITWCKQYIKEHWRDVEIKDDDILIYEDEGFSGGTTNRPEFLRMIKDIEARKIDAVVCYRMDRISRNVGDFAALVKLLSDMNVDFVSVTENFDTKTPMGIAMLHITSVFAELERNTIAERIRDNMHELAKTGRWLGGVCPLGYTSEKVSKDTVDGKVRTSHKLKKDEEESKLASLIFYKFLEVQSLTQTETFLIQNNYHTREGKDFSRFAIRNILSNPVYLIADENARNYFDENGVELFAEPEEFNGSYGIMAYNRTKQQSGKANQLNPMDEWIVTVGKHEGLIPGADWVKVQHLLDENKDKAYRYRSVRTNLALLSGTLYCSCGAPMRPKVTDRFNAHGERVYSYRCEMRDKSKKAKCGTKPLDGINLDRWLCEVLKVLAEDDSEFRRNLDKNKSVFLESRSDCEADLERVNKALDINKREIENLVSQLSRASQGGVGDILMAKIEELNKKGEELTQRAKELEKLTQTHVLTASQFDVYLNLLSTFSGTVDRMSLEQKRLAIRGLVRKAVWDGANVHLYLFGTDDDGYDGGMDFPAPPDNDDNFQNPRPSDGAEGNIQGEEVPTREKRKRDPDALPIPAEVPGGGLPLRLPGL